MVTLYIKNYIFHVYFFIITKITNYTTITLQKDI